MNLVSQLKVKIFADGADKKGLLDLYKNPHIKGFTTNPSLIRKAGVTDYESFAKDIIQHIPDRSLSFEVFADSITEMERQALKIKNWGEQVYVKIPIINTQRNSTLSLVKKLSEQNVKINLTAVFTKEQITEAVEALKSTPGAYISIFAGRIADAGQDPAPIVAHAVSLAKPYRNIEILWASTREVFNIFEADRLGVHIITVPHNILQKLSGVGTSLEDLTLDTVKTFYKDSTEAGYSL